TGSPVRTRPADSRGPRRSPAGRIRGPPPAGSAGTDVRLVRSGRTVGLARPQGGGPRILPAGDRRGPRESAGLVRTGEPVVRPRSASGGRRRAEGDLAHRSGPVG